MKRKLVSSDVADPGLNKGWAYIVDEVPYKAYLKDYKGKAEVFTPWFQYICDVTNHETQDKYLHGS